MKLKLLMSIIIVTANSLVAQSIITFSGSALSGLSSYDQPALKDKYRQFESEANLIFSAEISEKASTSIEFGIGVADSESGFTNGIDIQGYDITYKTDYVNTAVSVGLINVPYGQYETYQTSNSNVQSPFIYNDLGYTVLSRSSLNPFEGTGLKTDSNFGFGQIKTFLFNGTDGTAQNEDKGFGVAISYQTDSLVNMNFYGEPVNVNLGLSWLNVNDYGANTDVIDANTTGIILDAKVDTSYIEFGGYVSMLDLDDFDSSTQDDVNTYMIYVSKGVFGNVLLSARYSIITPRDYDADGSGVTSALTNVGLSNPTYLTMTDIETTRYQISAIVNLEENFNIHNEMILDTYYEEKYDTMAILSYASIKF